MTEQSPYSFHLIFIMGRPGHVPQGVGSDTQNMVQEWGAFDTFEV